jgi:hypothetical protein
MDYSGYSRLSSEHKLLNMLLSYENCASSENKEITTQDITSITQAIFRTINIVTDEKIFVAVKAAMKDFAKMPSSEMPNKVIGCAHRTLNILMKNEENPKNQRRLTSEIKQLDEFQAKINDLFALKSALVGHEDLRAILDDENFLNALGKLRTLNDSTLEIEPSTLLLLVQLWKNPEGQQLLKKFIEDASLLRTASVQSLAKNQVSLNIALFFEELKKTHLKLNIHFKHSFDSSNFEGLRRFFNQISKNVLITDLNVEELRNLYNLYQACHSFVSRNSDAKDLWESIKPKSSAIERDDKRHEINGMFPEEVASVLDLCENQLLCPYLSSLKFAQMLALVEEAFHLALEGEFKA